MWPYPTYIPYLDCSNDGRYSPNPNGPTSRMLRRSVSGGSGLDGGHWNDFVAHMLLPTPATIPRDKEAGHVPVNPKDLRQVLEKSGALAQR
jgi:hypothetical protein